MDWLHFWVLHIGLAVGFVLSALMVTTVLRQRLSASATVAWLMVIVMLPYVGIPLFLMLGGRKRRNLGDRKRSLTLPQPPSTPMVGELDRLIRSFGLPGATGGNTFSLYPDGEAMYRGLVDLIETAEHSIYIATFILHPDVVGKDILARLTRRAGEGIDVKVLLDGVGSMSTRKRFLEPLQKAGGRTAFFLPVLHVPSLFRTNLRNHRKIVVVDQQRAMAGGANIALEYIGPEPYAGRWRDLAFLVKGPAARMYLEIFREDWLFASGTDVAVTNGIPDVPRPGDAVVQVVPSGPDVRGDPLYDTLLSAIYSASRRVWVVTPYFVPDDALLTAMMIAVKRGVEVRVLVPRTSNHRLADVARGAALRDLQAQGGIIHQYPSMVHAKAWLVDEDLAVVGSANLDMRSLFLDHEVMLFLYSREDVAAVEGWTDALMRGTMEPVPPIGVVRDLFEGFIRIVAPLL